MSIETYKQITSWFNEGKKRKNLGFTTEGRWLLAPLVAVFGMLSSQEAIDATDPYKGKNFQVSINNGTDALKYLKLLTKPRWRKSSEFMPKANLDSSSSTVSARKALLMPQGKVVIPASLKAMLVNETLDINSLMEEGVKQTKEKLVPNFVRLVLMGEEAFDYEAAGIELETFQLLQKRFKDNPRMSVFMRSINRKGGKEKNGLESIIQFYVDKQNMFSEDEATKLEAIKDNMDEYETEAQHRNALNELYDNITPSLASTLYDLMDDLEEKGTSMFSKVGEYYKLNLQPLSKDDSETLIRDFRKLRSESESIKVTQEDSAWTNIEELYDENYDLSSVSGLKSTDIFHILAMLDWYYGQTDLYEKIQDWLNPDEYEEEDILFDEVKQSAIENYGEIIKAFIDAVKDRVEDIITRPKTYQDKLTYVAYDRNAEGRKTGGSKTKATMMIRDLQESEIVTVTE